MEPSNNMIILIAIILGFIIIISWNYLGKLPIFTVFKVKLKSKLGAFKIYIRR